MSAHARQWVELMGLTVGEDVGVVLSQHHHARVDARIPVLSTGYGPVDWDRVALEEVGEKEADGPGTDDGNVGPHGEVDEGALKDAVVKCFSRSHGDQTVEKLPFVEKQD